MGLDEIGRLLAKCPPAAFVPHPPDTRAIEKQCATDMGLDPATVEAWLAERGGEVREIEVRTSRGLRPGQVLSPPPRTTTVYYIVPNAALAQRFAKSPTRMAAAGDRPTLRR
jgi:hypothetical protein